MTTQTLMTVRQLANELNVNYQHMLYTVRETGLIDWAPSGKLIIVHVDDEKLATYRKASEISEKYHIYFSRALRMIQDGWTEPITESEQIL